jgi:hypothetical protein
LGEKTCPTATLSITISLYTELGFFSFLKSVSFFFVPFPYSFLCLHCLGLIVCLHCTTQNTNIHVSGGIRTRNPSKHARDQTRTARVRSRVLTAWATAKPFKDKDQPKLFKYSVRTAQQTLSISVINTNQLTPYRKITAICSEIHKQYINTIYRHNVQCLMLNLLIRHKTAGPERVMEPKPIVLVTRGKRHERMQKATM